VSSDLRGVAPDDEVRLARVDRELTAFVRGLRADLHTLPLSGAAVRAAGERVIDFLSLDALAGTLPEYAVGDALPLAVVSLLAYLQTNSWSACSARWRGTDETPCSRSTRARVSSTTLSSSSTSTTLDGAIIGAETARDSRRFSLPYRARANGSCSHTLAH
jgi:hypothetical protein